jgi:4-oxalocrotonate tautomerase
MPVITVTLGKTENLVKETLIRQLTQTAVEATKIPAPSFIVLINELEDMNIGLGGKTLAEVKASR